MSLRGRLGTPGSGRAETLESAPRREIALDKACIDYREWFRLKPKSKMNERKSWASSKTAKKSRAVFECLAANLLVGEVWMASGQSNMQW